MTSLHTCSSCDHHRPPLCGYKGLEVEPGDGIACATWTPVGGEPEPEFPKQKFTSQFNVIVRDNLTGDLAG